MTTTPPASESARRSADGPAQGAPESGESTARVKPAQVDADRTASAPAVRRRPVTVASEDEPDGIRRLLGYRRERFEARKVRRLIRHVDPWSMLKLSLLLSMCMWLIIMIASVVLWTVARNAGTVESIESFVNSSLSLQDWALDGDFLFRQFGLITLLLALGFAAATVVASLLFNLVSDIIGGVWISVIEEESARPVKDSNRSQPVS